MCVCVRKPALSTHRTRDAAESHPRAAESLVYRTRVPPEHIPSRNLKPPNEFGLRRWRRDHCNVDPPPSRLRETALRGQGELLLDRLHTGCVQVSPSTPWTRSRSPRTRSRSSVTPTHRPRRRHPSSVVPLVVGCMTVTWASTPTRPGTIDSDGDNPAGRNSQCVPARDHIIGGD